MLAMKVVSLELRKLKCKAIMKNLSLNEIAKATGIRYSEASQIWNGRINDGDRLAKIEKAIEKAPEVK